MFVIVYLTPHLQLAEYNTPPEHSGLPIITTNTGVSGLDLENEKDILIANTSQEFIDKITTILKNRDLYESIRKNAHRIAKAKYSWSSIAKELEIVYRSVIKKR
jgi:glycosyltransferase involved in cell wall biosynthesis